MFYDILPPRFIVKLFGHCGHDGSGEKNNDARENSMGNETCFITIFETTKSDKNYKSVSM